MASSANRVEEAILSRDQQPSVRTRLLRASIDFHLQPSKRRMMTLQNKIALVTGASRGIGRATATVLADAGAHVLVHYGRSVQEAESLLSAIQAKGGRADLVSADLASRDGAFLLAKKVGSGVATGSMCSY